MQKPVFFGRQVEIMKLHECLSKALSKQGNIVFISGEAGSGKTSLAAEFAKNIPSDVLLIKGTCNAQTGVGDPYFPCKQIFRALVGDVDGALTQGRINENCARILANDFLPSIEFLFRNGPDLVDILVSNSRINLLLKKYTEKHKSKRAKELLEASNRASFKSGLLVVQSNIFEQFFEVISELSNRHPLILLFDDLHWADSATINLLFYLGRRLERSRVFIVGAFRPEEVLIGRGNDRHPLEEILVEFKHYFGNIIIDLDQAAKSNGRSFVDSILDGESNIFDDGFRETLFRHTHGHALFTIELIESMKENGDIFKNADGHWAPKSAISWLNIPARVEGVIEKRISRLEPELHQILSIASVEGEGFTAEIVAQVRELSEKIILRQLSQDLEKKHRLIREQGEIKVNHQTLQRFQFSHSLFQQYIYAQLGIGERRIIHAEIANTLEKLYAGDTDDVLMELVRHYTESGNDEKAKTFLIKAGNMATKSYAFTEARLHYKNARTILLGLENTETHRREHVELIFKYMTVSSSSDSPDEIIQLSEEAERLVNGFLISEGSPTHNSPLEADWDRLARIYLWTGRAYYNSNQLYEAIRYYNKVIPISKGIGNEHLLSMATALIGRSLATQGHFQKAESIIIETQDSIEKAASWHDWIWNIEFLSSCLAIQGKVNDGYILANKGLMKAEEIKYLMAIAMAHSHLALIFRAANKPDIMLEHSIQTTKIAEQSGDRLFVYIGYGLQAWASLMLGEIEKAQELIKLSIDSRISIAKKLVRMDWFTAVEAEIALAAGELQQAMNLSEKVIRMAQPMGGIFSQAIAHRVWGQAIAALAPHQWNDVESHMDSALHFFQTGNAIVELAHTHLTWGNLYKNKGELGRARQQYLESEALFEQVDLNLDAVNIKDQILQIDGLRGLSGIVDMEISRTEHTEGTVSYLKVREILNAQYDDPKLDALCMDYFPEVYNKFSRGLQKDEKVNILINYCRRSLNELRRLREILNIA